MYIKGFDKELKCRDFQYEVGNEYKIDTKKPLQLCTDTVFHFCDSIQYVHAFYDCGGDNRFCEVEVLGELVSDDVKCGSNHIKIVREIVGDELNILLGKVNGNTGLFNTGNCNTGNCNTGDCNTGHRNTGDCNTGDCNTGDCNTGYCNTGYCNTGDFNSCNYSSGFFCTEDPKARIFNIDTNMTVSKFKKSKYYTALYSSPFVLTEWTEYTDSEKKTSKEKELIGGYLKKYTYQEACKNWWDKMSNDNKKIVKSIPNFNPQIFKEITGIEV